MPLTTMFPWFQFSPDFLVAVLTTFTTMVMCVVFTMLNESTKCYMYVTQEYLGEEKKRENYKVNPETTRIENNNY